MDSMRSLNTSLPSSSSQQHHHRHHHRRRRQQNHHSSYPPAGLHQAFKAAAFSVTQLYKAAAADEEAARAAGYQEALDELLGFLDRENLGLGDGEGWRVRRWATERLTPDVYASGSDEDEGDDAANAAAQREPADKMVTESRGTADARDSTPREDQAGTTRQQQQQLLLQQQPQLSDSMDLNSTDQDVARSQGSDASNALDQQAKNAPSEVFHFTARPQMPPADADALSTSSTTSSRSARPLKHAVWGQLSALRRPSRERTALGGAGVGSKRRSPSHSDFDFVGFADYGHGGSVFGNVKRRRRGE